MSHETTEGPVSPHTPFRPPTAAPPLASGRPVVATRSNIPPPSAISVVKAARTPAQKPESPPQPVVVQTPPAVPKPGRHSATLDRDQILAATAECLDDVGLDKTTIRSIAKRLNCAVGSIYRYYTDKHELLEAVCEQRFVAVVDAIQAGQTPDQTARLYHAAASARPEQYRLMFWLASVGRSPEQPAQLPGVIATVVAGWARQLDDPNAARCRWALLHGQLMLDADLDCDLLPDLPSHASAPED